jgi:hypothetical protein
MDIAKQNLSNRKKAVHKGGAGWKALLYKLSFTSFALQALLSFNSETGEFFRVDSVVEIK